MKLLLRFDGFRLACGRSLFYSSDPLAPEGVVALENSRISYLCTGPRRNVSVPEGFEKAECFVVYEAKEEEAKKLRHYLCREVPDYATPVDALKAKGTICTNCGEWTDGPCEKCGSKDVAEVFEWRGLKVPKWDEVVKGEKTSSVEEAYMTDRNFHLWLSEVAKATELAEGAEIRIRKPMVSTIGRIVREEGAGFEVVGGRVVGCGVYVVFWAPGCRRRFYAKVRDLQREDLEDLDKEDLLTVAKIAPEFAKRNHEVFLAKLGKAPNSAVVNEERRKILEAVKKAVKDVLTSLPSWADGAYVDSGNAYPVKRSKFSEEAFVFRKKWKSVRTIPALNGKLVLKPGKVARAKVVDEGDFVVVEFA